MVSAEHRDLPLAIKKSGCGVTLGRMAPENGRLGRLAGGAPVALSPGMPLETALGRSLALVVHPHAAWRVLRPRGRAFLVGAYFLVGYAGALTLLLSIR